VKVLRDLFKDYRFCFSFIVLVIILTMALLSTVSPYDPTLWNVVPKNMPPSAKYPFGTDSNGQDIFWQATYAVRNSLIISLIAASISRVIAVLVGMVAGYKGGNTNRVLMFISDGLLVIPLFLILVMLAMMVRQHMSMVVLGLMLSFFGWAWDARVIRSVILSLRERDFTKTAILSGTGDRIGDDAGAPWIGRCQRSHPGHDAELGDHISGHVFGTLELGLDAGDPGGSHVYRALLAFGQHQRVFGSKDADPEGWSVMETQP
jgi:hypothetical protein